MQRITKRSAILLSMVLLCLLSSALARQTNILRQGKVTITFEGMPASPKYQLPYQGDNTFVIRVPKSYKPLVEGDLAFQRTEDAENLIFLFRLQPNTVATVKPIAGGVEIDFGPQDIVNASATTAEIKTKTDISSGTEKSTAVTTTTFGPPEPVTVRTESTVIPTPVQPPPPPQAANTGANIVQVKNQSVDMSVPESPAFTVLGLSPQDVVRPTSPRALATSLINSVDQNGNFQSGVAIDTAPYLLLAGSNVTIADYRKSLATRLLSRTDFSFATTKGASSEDKSTRLALGLYLTLYDSGDPRMDQDLTACFERSLNKTFVAKDDKGNPVFPGLLSADELERQRKEFLEEVIKPAAEICRQASQKKNWNRSSWIVAAAPSWIGTTGQVNDLKWNGGGVWTSFGYGFDSIPGLRDKAQLIVHARYRTKESAADPLNVGQFVVQNSGIFGTSFRAGSPNFNASGEFVYQHTKPVGGKVDNSYRLSLSAERRVMDNIWFTLSFGGEGSHNNGNNKVFVMTSFRWGFTQDPGLTLNQAAKKNP